MDWSTILVSVVLSWIAVSIKEALLIRELEKQFKEYLDESVRIVEKTIKDKFG